MDADAPLRHRGPMTQTTPHFVQHQPFASLIAIDPDSARITHASANCADGFGHAPADLLGADARDLLAREVWHALRNAAAHPDFATSSVEMSDTGALHVIELSPRLPSELGATPVHEVARSAMAQFLPLDTIADLASALARFVHRVTGYDHVVMWQAPAPGGSDTRVMAEAKRLSRASALGDAADWSDLWRAGDPALGVVADRAAPPVPVLSRSEAPAALDLTQALCALAPTGRASLLEGREMAAALHLRLTCRGQPWGVLDCQSVRPRRPSAQVIALCQTLLPFLDAKLQSLTL
jgi:light-regulated signal transduction histidine kinase (bacteriophytochrome)